MAIEEIDPVTGKPKAKPTVNFPYPQPGQNLPMVPAAVQQAPLGAAGGPQPAAQGAPPTVQPIAPVAKPVQTGVATGAAQVFNPNLSQQVVQQAQTQAMQGTNTGTSSLVSQQTQSLLKDPSLGKDYEAQKKLALDQLARKQASDLEALRQATGGTANLGINVQDLMQMQLGQRQERTDIGRQYDIDAQQQKQKDMLAALAAGKETVGMEQGLATSNIQNMITASGGALGFAELAAKQDILLSQQDFQAAQNALDKELKLAMQSNDINAQKSILEKQLAFEAKQQALGYQFTAEQNNLNRLLQQNLASLDAATQKEVIGLKAQVDKDMLLSQQSFQATQANLQRQFEEAMKIGDYAQATKMQNMMNEFETMKQKSQQAWQSAENLAQNAFTSNMQMKEQDYNKAMQYLKFEQEKALQSNNTELQKILMDKQSALDMQKQLQGFNHNEKMAVLQAEIDKAKSTADFEKQKTLLGMQHGLEMDKIEKEQGFAKSMAYVDAELKKALQNNDFANAQVLAAEQYKQQMLMHKDNLAIQNAKLALEKQGMDMAKVEMEYNKIQDQIKQGQLDPSMGVEYLKQAFKSSLPVGFTFKEPDPLATQKAIQQDFLNQQYQYALAQGVDPKTGKPTKAKFDPKTGAFIGLTDDAQAGFNTYLQETVFGQTGTPLQADIIALKAGEIPPDQIKPGDEKYKYLLSDSTVPKIANANEFTKEATEETGEGGDSRKIFSALENNKYVSFRSNLYYVKGSSINDKAGDDDTVYTIVNLATGKESTIVASNTKSQWQGNKVA